MEESGINEELLSLATKLIANLHPGETEVNENLVKSFSIFFFSLPVEEQCGLYDLFGSELNKALYEQTKATVNVQNIDIEKLLKSSSMDIFNDADERLTRTHSLPYRRVMQNFIK